MDHYYVNENAQDNGDHEVHKQDCSWLALTTNKKYLGYYSTCQEAVIEAKKTYPQSNGCKHCCLPCHTS